MAAEEWFRASAGFASTQLQRTSAAVLRLNKQLESLLARLQCDGNFLDQASLLRMAFQHLRKLLVTAALESILAVAACAPKPCLSIASMRTGPDMAQPSARSFCPKVATHHILDLFGGRAAVFVNIQVSTSHFAHQLKSILLDFLQWGKVTCAFARIESCLIRVQEPRKLFVTSHEGGHAQTVQQTTPFVL